MRFFRKLFATFFVFSFLTILLAAAGGIGYVKHITPKLPDHLALKGWKPSEGTTILGRDGSVLGVHAAERREFVPLSDIPVQVQNAFLAAEDGKYWSHSGIDILAIARAAMANFQSNDRPEGGSTITQQVIKNVLLNSERTLDRKFKEAILAVRADRDLGKEKILEIYLNEIYFGAGAYGVAVASMTYFDKTLDQLTLPEAALLAGLPKAPSAANPFINPQRAAERRNYVLTRMEVEGFISADDRIAASNSALPQKGVSEHRSTQADPAMWYPQETVRRSLLETIGSDRLYKNGGTVTTTIDPTLQKIVHLELRRGLVDQDRKTGWRGPISKVDPSTVDWTSPALQAPAGSEDWQVAIITNVTKSLVLQSQTGPIELPRSHVEWAVGKRKLSAVFSVGDVVLVGDVGRGSELVQVPDIQGAVVIMDPRKGSVLAMDGGFSHETSEFNRATQAKRQTGSVFKPIVYLAAIEEGYDAMSPILDSPIAIDQGAGLADWRPESGNDGGLGLITLRLALEKSRNMSTVRLLYDLGMPTVIDLIRRLGLNISDDAGYTMALGTSEATPLEMAQVYSSFANGGYRVTPTFLSGQMSDPISSVDPIATAKLTSILEGVVTHGTARRAFAGFKKPVAAKTGTTNDARDIWLAAYGPEFVVVGWMGRDDHKPLAKGSSGSGSVATMVRNILEKADGNLIFADFSIPANAQTLRVDRATGMPDNNGNVLEILTEEVGHDILDTE